VPDDRLKLRVTVAGMEQKFRDMRKAGHGLTHQQLTPPAKVGPVQCSAVQCSAVQCSAVQCGAQVPSSPTCSSPERGGEGDSLYGDHYGKLYNRLGEWSAQNQYHAQYHSQYYAQRSSPAMYHRTIKTEPCSAPMGLPGTPGGLQPGTSSPPTPSVQQRMHLNSAL
jgi:hypothetical protein